MAQRRPWKVDYKYKDGPKGRIALPGRPEAIRQIAEIERNCYPDSGEVTVKLSCVDIDDGATLETWTFPEVRR